MAGQVPARKTAPPAKPAASAGAKATPLRAAPAPRAAARSAPTVARAPVVAPVGASAKPATKATKPVPKPTAKLPTERGAKPAPTRDATSAPLPVPAPIPAPAAATVRPKAAAPLAVTREREAAPPTPADPAAPAASVARRPEAAPASRPAEAAGVPATPSQAATPVQPPRPPEKAQGLPPAAPAASPAAASGPTTAPTPGPVTGTPPAEARPMSHMGMNGRPPVISRNSGKDEIFAEGDHVVYPTHGVGRVEKIAREEIAGHQLELIHVTFEENRMTLRVPVAKARTAGLRKLATRKLFDEALAVLRGRARIKRTMWSRRAQEYEAKINSGDPLAIAEVVRDLHRNAGQPDQSFSERQIYEQAMDRLAAELGALDETDKNTAATKLADFLKAVA